MQLKAKLFQNGQSQAVRLPKAFRFQGNEVCIQKIGDKVVLSEVAPSWESFFNNKSVFDDDFLENRDNDVPQERESF